MMKGYYGIVSEQDDRKMGEKILFPELYPDETFEVGVKSGQTITVFRPNGDRVICISGAI